MWQMYPRRPLRYFDCSGCGEQYLIWSFPPWLDQFFLLISLINTQSSRSTPPHPGLLLHLEQNLAKDTSFLVSICIKSVNVLIHLFIMLCERFKLWYHLWSSIIQFIWYSTPISHARNYNLFPCLFPSLENHSCLISFTSKNFSFF